jgi:hypothetical protein
MKRKKKKDWKKIYYKMFAFFWGETPTEPNFFNFTNRLERVDCEWMYAFPPICTHHQAEVLNEILSIEEVRLYKGKEIIIANKQLLEEGWYLFDPFFKGTIEFYKMLESDSIQYRILEGQYYVRTLNEKCK